MCDLPKGINEAFSGAETHPAPFRDLSPSTIAFLEKVPLQSD